MDPTRLRGLKNLYLLTDIGRIDMLGEVTGLGSFEEVLAHTQVAEVEGHSFRVLDLVLYRFRNVTPRTL